MSESGLERTTIVVVTYNSAHCFDALAGLLERCPHVVISDNGSFDGSAELACTRWPHARVIRHGRNLGFGAANNRALGVTQTPYALLLNPDCELSVSSLEKLIDRMDDDPDAAVIAPQLVNDRRQPVVNYRWPSVMWKSSGPGATGQACVGFVCGAVMLLRLAQFEGVGFFDEEFFLYFEDDDLCLRLFKARKPMIIDPEVTVFHRSRGSVRGRNPLRHEFDRGFHHIQSKLIFQFKHGETGKIAARRWALLAQTALALPLRLLAFSPRLLARMLGRFWGLVVWPRRESGSRQ